jgi:hypothetical protein
MSRSSPEKGEMTLVVNCRRDPYDVFIGRPGPWGNPFVIGRDGSRAEVIRLYAQWIVTQPRLIADLPSLRGRRLGCYCKPLPCHGDVLVRLVEELAMTTTLAQELRVGDVLNGKRVTEVWFPSSHLRAVAFRTEGDGRKWLMPKRMKIDVQRSG